MTISIQKKALEFIRLLGVPQGPYNVSVLSKPTTAPMLRPVNGLLLLNLWGWYGFRNASNISEEEMRLLPNLLSTAAQLEDILGWWERVTEAAEVAMVLNQLGGTNNQYRAWSAKTAVELGHFLSLRETQMSLHNQWHVLQKFQDPAVGLHIPAVLLQEDIPNEVFANEFIKHYKKDGTAQ